MIKILGRVSLTVLLTLAFAGALLVAALLTAVEFFAPPSFSTSLATVQNVTADAWLVFDPGAGQIIYDHNSEAVLPMASIAKLPAAKVFYDKADIWATTTITWSDLAHDGRAGSLAYGEIYSFHELLFPLLLNSSNDAAGNLERNHPSLIEEMNTYAEGLNLNKTVFADASGLTASGVTTARELSRIVSDIKSSNQHLLNITSLPFYSSGERGWRNNNPFVSDARYTGGKHGYTPEAGYTAVAIFNEYLKNGVEREVGYVLLGSSDLEYDVSLLRNQVQTYVSFK